jgi:hypothetical protein
MTQTHGSTVDIHSFRINIQPFHIGQHNHAKSFVDFPQRNIFFSNLKANEILKVENGRYYFQIFVPQHVSEQLVSQIRGQ